MYDINIGLNEQNIFSILTFKFHEWHTRSLFDDLFLCALFGYADDWILRIDVKSHSDVDVAHKYNPNDIAYHDYAVIFENTVLDAQKRVNTIRNLH